MKHGILTVLIAFTIVTLAASSASASIQVLLSESPVNCHDLFRVTAKLTMDTSNMRAEFFIDDYKFAWKNLQGGISDATVTFGSQDWDRLKPGHHTATIQVLKLDTLIDEGSTQFDVAGSRCPTTTTTTTIPTTTTLPGVACSSNADCKKPVLGTPYCNDINVTQTVTYGQCQNPSTIESACIDKEEFIVVQSCLANQVCDAGLCLNVTGETTTTSTSTSTTSTLAPTTTTTTESTTSSTTTSTTQTTQTTTSSTTTSTLFQRTNTKLDRILEVVEAILRIIMFWK